MQSFWDKWILLFGLTEQASSHGEKLLSGIGGATAIGLVFWVSQFFVTAADAVWLIPSIGASAVLLFAVPHGPLSQPWPLVGGHLVSAAAGVSCVLVIPDALLAASLAVGLAITLMYYLRCLHPPGGATALVAVIGGESIHALGYQFLWTPVLLNVLVILGVAVVFNALFSWRRYPAYFKPAPKMKKEETFSHADFLHALKEMDSFVDVNEQDLQRIFTLIHQHQQSVPGPQIALRVGAYYSNGSLDKAWRIRQIVALRSGKSAGHNQVTYREVCGSHLAEPKTVSTQDFLEWAKLEVESNQGCWSRKF
ncbi:MAG: HPP family protein [Thiotrichales bacterium]|nr:HPP family protein [Thiotrichales bacterium]